MLKLIIVLSIVLSVCGCGQEPVFADEIDSIIPFIIQAESSGNPNAVSKAGAVGLCQITKIVLDEWNSVGITERNYRDGYQEYYYIKGHRIMGEWVATHPYDYNISELYDPQTNMRIGTWYLRRLRDYYLKDIVTIVPEGCSGVVDANYDRMVGEWRKGWIDKGSYYQIIRTNQDQNLALILAAYNMGPTALKRIDYDINKAPEETRDYVKKVMKAYKESR